jgi:hypothetical protein
MANNLISFPECLPPIGKMCFQVGAKDVLEKIDEPDDLNDLENPEDIENKSITNLSSFLPSSK